MRRVAAEAQIPTSSLYELFSSQDAVRAAVMREVTDRMGQRLAAMPADLSGQQWARAAHRGLLPPNPQPRQEVIATLYIGALGLHNPDLRAAWRLADDAVRETCRRALDAMGPDGGQAQQDQLHVVIDRLGRQVVMHDHQRSPDWAIAVLDRMLPA